MQKRGLESDLGLKQKRRMEGSLASLKAVKGPTVQQGQEWGTAEFLLRAVGWRPPAVGNVCWGQCPLFLQESPLCSAQWHLAQKEETIIPPASFSDLAADADIPLKKHELSTL